MNTKKIKPSSASVPSDSQKRTIRHYFHSRKLGNCQAYIIDESENLLRRPVATDMSHVDMVNRVIDEYEAQIALKAEISALYKDLLNLLRHAEQIDLANDAEFEETMAELEFIRAEIARLESAQDW